MRVSIDQFTVAFVDDPALGESVAVLRREGSSSAEVRVAPSLGSNLYSYNVSGTELIYCDMERLAQRKWTGNFVMWPIPNRVRNKRYTFEGKTTSLEDIDRGEGDGPCIHGLVDNQVFKVVNSSADASGARVITSIAIVEGTPMFRHFPYASRLTLTYELTSDAVTVFYRVESLDDTPVPFGFGLHPYFATFGEVDNTWVQVQAADYMERAEGLIPTGRTLPVADSAFDAREPQPVGSLSVDVDYLNLVPDAPLVMSWDSLGKTLYCEASPDFEHSVLYTEVRDDFICLEYQTGATDMINLNEKAINTGDEILRKDANLIVVQPGQSHEGFIRFRIAGN